MLRRASPEIAIACALSQASPVTSTGRFWMAKRTASGRPRRRRESIPGTKQQARRRDNLASMSVAALLALRDNIGAVLSQRTAELQRQLQRLEITGRTATRAKGSGGKYSTKVPRPRQPGQHLGRPWRHTKVDGWKAQRRHARGFPDWRFRSQKATREKGEQAREDQDQRQGRQPRSKRALRAARPRSATASIPNVLLGSNGARHPIDPL